MTAENLRCVYMFVCIKVYLYIEKLNVIENHPKMTLTILMIENYVQIYS